MPSKIADSELEVMRILWREDRPVSYAEIRQELESKTDWSRSTIQTLVMRLRDKGTVSSHFHHVTLYTANVSERDYRQFEEQKFLDRLFDGNARNLVTALCQDGKLNENDIDELKAYFQIGSDRK